MSVAPELRWKVVGLGLLALAVVACGDLAPGTPPESPLGALPSAAASLEPTPAGSGPASPRARAGIVPALALPVRSRTPGAVDPAVTQADLARTVCVTGYTTKVRPPVSYTGTLKRTQLAGWGYADRDPAHYEEDHLIPLSLGGAPRDERNLWPEPRTAVGSDGVDYGAATKDDYELWLHDQVCSGRLSLVAAQQAVATDWIAGWEAAGRP